MSLQEPKLGAYCKACGNVVDAFNDKNVSMFVDEAGSTIGIKWRCVCGLRLRVRCAGS